MTHTEWADLSVLQPKSHVFRSHHRYAVFLQLLLPGIRESHFDRPDSSSDCKVISTFVSERAVSRSFSLVFGFLMFGQPLISYSMKELDRSIPDWKSRLVLEL